MPKIIFILSIIFLNFPTQIYSISGTNEELFEINLGNENELEPENVCPCDLTKDVCDQCCYCDEDCSTQILHYDYVDVCGEGDSSSYVRQNIDENLEYCNDFKKTLDELYNPLVLGFQILKRGLCLYQNKNKLKNDDNNSEEGPNKSENTIDFSAFLPGGNINNEATTCEDFEKMNINATMALPSGFCLFGAYPIKCLINYEITCTYPSNKLSEVVKYKNKILGSYSNEEKNNYYNITNYYYEESQSLLDNDQNYYIKKMEIIFNVNKENTALDKTDISLSEYNIYYGTKNNKNNEGYLDFTQTVTFLQKNTTNLTDYLRSGSPGYIKGKPILIGEYESSYKCVHKLKQNFVIPLLGTNCPTDKDDKNYYYDNYLDNLLTFEDTVIFSCKRPKDSDSDNYKNYKLPIFSNINFLRFGKYGNSFMENIDSWSIFDVTNIDQNGFPVLYIDYIYQGSVNSTQFFIDRMNYTIHNDVEINDNYYFFIVKSLTPYERKTKMFTARPPGILKLPRNIMYPFRSETTTYRNKQ